jgi:hypothetical protein
MARDCYGSFNNCQTVTVKESWTLTLENYGPAKYDPFTDPNSLAYGVFMTPDSQRIWSSANDTVKVGTIFESTGVALAIGAPVAAEGVAVINEMSAPYWQTPAAQTGWRWAFRGSMYSAPVLTRAWNWVKRNW